MLHSTLWGVPSGWVLAVNTLHSGALPLPPQSAWGTEPLGPAPLTVPLDASQSSLTRVGPILLLELGCCPLCLTRVGPTLLLELGHSPLSAWGAAPLSPTLLTVPLDTSHCNWALEARGMWVGVDAQRHGREICSVFSLVGERTRGWVEEEPLG